MRYIKEYYNYTKPRIQLYNADNTSDKHYIKVSENEFYELRSVEKFHIIRFEKKWLYRNEDKEKIENWLSVYRSITDDVYQDTKKYNI